MIASIVFSIGLTGILLTACVFDLRQFRIPNALPLALIAVFVIKAAAIAGVAVWPGHLAAFAITLGLGILAFSFGCIGGGDAKLIAALALWFGLPDLPSFLAMTGMAGGILALTLVVLRRLPRPSTAHPSMSSTAPKLLDRGAPIPYALPIAFAALWLEWQ